MKDEKLITSWKENNPQIENVDLSEFISIQVQEICFQYTDSTGEIMPKELIRVITNRLLRSYFKCEVSKFE